MQVCLHLMRHNIAGGVPKYVFAVARKKARGDIGPEDIRAIATLTSRYEWGSAAENEMTRTRWRWGSDGRQTEMLEVTEVIARPTSRRHSFKVAELVESVRRWAGDTDRVVVSVAPSPAVEFQVYYEGLGFEPDELMEPSRLIVQEEGGRPEVQLVRLDK
mmetsp:Transcript_111242/g.314884  ORF Transcript_111242/g.314884 Transcript_111242/m.314884 type:complete len:160 (-) Transcript_111242:68-547(-)